MHTDPIRAFISQRINEIGANEKSISIAIGANEAYMNQYLKRGIPKILPEDKRQLLAKELRVSEMRLRSDKIGYGHNDIMIGDSPKPPATAVDSTSGKSTRALHTDVPVIYGDPYIYGMISVLGNANGSGEAVILNFDDPIGEAKRHPAQEGMRGAFALHTRGESMTPRYFPGDLVYVIANQPPAREQDCIVEMQNGESYLKVFVKITEKEVICRQYSPAKEWTRPASEVKSVHAVVGRG